MMKRYDNLPPKQRAVQRRVDQFNAAEEAWRSLEGKRRRRRRGFPRLSAECLQQLDLLEFARTRPPQDCIGFVPLRPPS
jgi:hypothetical protein